MGKRRRKSRFVGVRLTDEQYQKLVILSSSSARAGNISEQICKLIDMVPINSAQFCGDFVVRAAFVWFPREQPQYGDEKTQPVPIDPVTYAKLRRGFDACQEGELET